MKRSYFFYGAVLLVALFSVQTGLEVVPAPMSPMPEIKVVAFTLPPPPAPPPVAAKPPVPVAVTPPVAAPAPPVAPKPVQPLPIAAVTPAAPPADITPVAETPKALCDVTACAAAYRSFRESDCTYNPSSGPRRLCTKGVVPKETAAPAPTAPRVPEPPKDVGAASDMPSIANPEPGTAAEPSANPICNVSACAAAYPRSFREADCTFNPSSGPRKVCTK